MYKKLLFFFEKPLYNNSIWDRGAFVSAPPVICHQDFLESFITPKQ